MKILLFFSFLAGFMTILAPCIWPLLPIVFSAASSGGKRKSLGITLGVMVSFTIFTLGISYLVKIFPINPNHLRFLATVIIAFLGLSLLIPSLGARFEVFINNVLGPLQSKFKKEGDGFIAGLVTGFSLGLVWAPCAGPILATIATLAATQAVNLKVIAITIAYVLGLGIPLFILSSLSAGWFKKMRQVNKFTGLIQQGLGLVMIISAILILTNFDKVIQVKVLNLFPGYSKLVGGFENNPLLQKELNALTGNKDRQAVASKDGSLPDLGLAPDFAGIAQWLNSKALTIESLKGKVVFVDFWTYSCVNCVRTLPHTTAWYEKYKDAGFVLIGVHTPEFAFEKETQNVANALKQFNITYPVAQDNDFKTWKNYQNHYWPAGYLIDAKGRIRRQHFGEGGYEEMELAIQTLLKENGHQVSSEVAVVKMQAPRQPRTAETYLGQRRMERFASPEKVVLGTQVLTLPTELPLNHFAYQGSWDIQAQYAKASSGSALELQFQAGKVFLVIGPSQTGDQIKVLMDGKIVDGAVSGHDVKDGFVVLDHERLYELIDLKENPGIHHLRLEFLSDGASVYAFTFGA